MRLRPGSSSGSPCCSRAPMIGSGLLTDRYAQRPAAPSARARSAAIQPRRLPEHVGEMRLERRRQARRCDRGRGTSGSGCGAVVRCAPRPCAFAQNCLRAGSVAGSRRRHDRARNGGPETPSRLVAFRAPAFAGAERDDGDAAQPIRLAVSSAPSSRRAARSAWTRRAQRPTRPGCGTAATTAPADVGRLRLPVGRGARRLRRGCRRRRSRGGGDAGCSAAEGGAEAGGALDAGGAAGAGGGLGASPRREQFERVDVRLPSPTRIPRWTYGTSCSASPRGAGVRDSGALGDRRALRVRERARDA